ncbi:hypothetical protein FACS1894172_05760 [Spirochaetia bacterium]|nr:hypothetical protein FACS1894164_19720 [Spirochaetia bacterium]GHU31220.1 hypothetical protein FACS1894172_05760 [Spirochaetia bacterium]
MTQKKIAKYGKVFVLEQTADNEHKPKINIDDLEWDYLPNDGDFRSSEVSKLRKEVDIIVTNPPFSLFREFIKWIMDAEKQFLIIGNMNAITYKEVFPLIKDNKMWLAMVLTQVMRILRHPLRRIMAMACIMPTPAW